VRTGVAFACGLALLHIVAARADDAACTGEPFGDGQVKSVIDGRTLLLTDGREVRLAGIEAPEQGKAALVSLAAGHDVALLRLGPDTDRYGRTVALVALQDEPARNSVQTRLLERGQARVSAHIGYFSCAAALLGAERRARTAGLGLWADPYYVMRNAEDPAGILAVRG
jgi:endonuclease YncB( thermonuclease family)